MSARGKTDQPDRDLLDWLTRNRVDYEIHQHRRAFTAVATARAEGTDPRTFAKVVGVAADDGRKALVVLDAPDHLALPKAARALGADDVRLLTEAELTELAPGCEPGAIPPVGSLYGLPIYADWAVRDEPEVSFNAGSHRYSVRVERAAWERAGGVAYSDLAREEDDRPAWARS